MQMCIVYIFSYNSFKKEHLMLQNDEIYRTYTIFEFNTCHVDSRQLNNGSMDLQI